MIVQFGGQTPLKLAVALERGRRADPRHPRRRDRPRRGSRAVRRGARRSSACARRAGASRARSRRRARSPREIGFPVMVRPSYVLGGRAMELVYDATSSRLLRRDVRGGAATRGDAAPLLVDQFLDGRGRARRRRVADGKRRRRRRRHGAHRGGRHPLRRLRVRAAAATRSPTEIVDEVEAADARCSRPSSAWSA